MLRSRAAGVAATIAIAIGGALAPLTAAHGEGLGDRAGAAATSAGPALSKRQAQPLGLVPRIVNGIRVGGAYPTVARVGRTDFGLLCTGTLVGCQTVLTAAHCIVPPVKADAHYVFLQHAGFVGVSSITKHPDASFGERSDLAILTLSSPVTGIAPSIINTAAEPPLGTLGDIAGFGGTGGVGNPSAGILRAGDVVTASCTVVPESSHLCWNFTNPLGAPGTDSNTCGGDSGGPLFANVTNLGLALAGVTSGGSAGTCLPPDNAFDADVHYDHGWIETAAGGDLAPVTCGTTPPLTPADVLVDRSSMIGSDPGFYYEIAVPAGKSELRVTTNGQFSPAQDYDLYLNFGELPPSYDPPQADCASRNGTTFEACSIAAPAAGTWFVVVLNPEGHQGEYDLTVSLLGAPNGPCADLDADGNGMITALTDGQLALRFLLTITGSALTSGALGSGATRDAAAIVDYLGGCSAALDIDGDGDGAAPTDGLLFIRYLFGVRGPALVDGAVSEDCTRCEPSLIEAHIASFL